VNTRVVSHRTSQLIAREISLDGIEMEAGIGADVVEIDARRAHGGTPVLLHDSWLGRVQHVPLPLKWAPPSLLVRLRVPTLVEALETVRAHGLTVAIDTKDPGAALAVIEAVNETAMLDHVLPWSQHMPAVRAYIRAWPDAEVALLRETHDDEANKRLLRDAAAIGARAVSCNEDIVTPEFVAQARDAGLLVYVWYQQRPKMQERLVSVAEAGLHGVVSDWPEIARSLLALG
jgi:glycerophosphoryl diester phosphodiesterase